MVVVVSGTVVVVVVSGTVVVVVSGAVVVVTFTVSGTVVATIGGIVATISGTVVVVVVVVVVTGMAMARIGNWIDTMGAFPPVNPVFGFNSFFSTPFLGRAIEGAGFGVIGVRTAGGSGLETV